MRAKDDAIPSAERLFRRLRAGQFVQTQVLPEAVDLRGTSCDREAYRRPGDLLSSEWPAVAVTTSAELPTSAAPTKDPPTWEFFSVDAPEELNEAHCEIRIRRSGRIESENDTNAINKRPRVVREELKAALAGRFRVLLP